MSSNDSPDIVLDAVERMRRDWELVSDLLGGTNAMRKAGEKHLPKWPKEEKESYQERLQRSTLLPAFSETVKNLAGRVLARPITLGDEVPGDIAGWCNDDIDLMGNNLDVFAGEWFRTGLGYGLCHCLVDYPPSDGVKTIAQEREEGIRPYSVLIRPQQVLGYRYRVERGRPVLTQFRYMEEIEEEDGEFGSKNVQQVRVLEINRWATYRRDGSGWALHDEGNESPLVF
ncbi:DNA-binding protein, partial [Pseudomonas aeruginosa]